MSADLAHLVERDLAKVEVAGSSPVIRSKFHRNRDGIFSFGQDVSFRPRYFLQIKNAIGGGHASFASRANFVAKAVVCKMYNFVYNKSIKTKWRT